jgi:tetratricopeptide (TPR) repeat protein
MTYLQWGQESAAIKEFNCSHYLASRRNLLPVMGLALFGKANAHYRIRDYPLAANFLQHAIGAFERCDDRLGLADAYKLKGMCHRDMKKYALATSYFLTSLRMNRELKNRLNEAETWFEMGLLERQRRRKEETLKAFTEALAIFKEIGAAADVKRTEQEICTTNGGRHVS